MKKVNKINIDLDKLLGAPQSAYEFFNRNTEIKQENSLKTLPIHQYKTYYKAYDRFPIIKLSKKKLPKVSFSSILENRSSQRQSSKSSSISIEDIGSLMYHCLGQKDEQGLRFYPSAGGRYPLEAYLIPNKVSYLQKRGVYHYNVRGHYLEERIPSNTTALSNCFQQSFVARSDAIIIITGTFKRTSIKYGERGYRYVLMESGHVGQNIYLVGKSLKMAVCGICGFYDKNINEYLDIDGVSESSLYCFTLNSQ